MAVAPLGSADDKLRQQAIEALVSLPDAGRPFVRKADKDANARVSSGGAVVLARWASTAEELKPFLSDKRVEVRKAAAARIGDVPIGLGPRQELVGLVISDADANVRATALGALRSSLGDEALRIEHAPVGCMLTGQFQVIEASIEPRTAVGSARLLFRSGLGENYYFVPMELVGKRFVGKTPKPKLEASHVWYRIWASRLSVPVMAEKLPRPELDRELGALLSWTITRDVAVWRVGRRITRLVDAEPQSSGEATALLVRDAKECPEGLTIAAVGKPGAVTVYSSQKEQ